MPDTEKRQRIVARIAQYEKEGRFNEDVEEDDPLYL